MNQGFVGKTVVIVEDSMIIQNDLAQAYESLGMKVLSICGDGRTAIDQYQQYSPDLISLDIIIPDMHGIECYRTLKKAHANLKCLLFLLSRQIARSSRSAKMRYPGIFFLVSLSMSRIWRIAYTRSSAVMTMPTWSQHKSSL